MISTVDSGVLRLGLRVYFIGTLLLISMIGGLCCRSAAKYDLLKGNHVKLNRMTGWVRFRDVLVVMWKFRRLPGGWWLGFTMIVASALALVSDLAVSKLVYSFYDTGLCEFNGTGLVFNPIVETWIVPPAQAYPALIASNAQITTSSDCLVGIYRKIPDDGGLMFCANEYDVIGRWSCYAGKAKDGTTEDRIFSASANDTEIGNYLFQHGLQYTTDTRGTETTNAKNQTTHVVIWSSSVADSAAKPFTVLVSVELNGSFESAKTMRTFNCSSESTTGDSTTIDQALSQMHSVTTLEQWAPGLERVFYTGDGSNASDYGRRNLEQYLNTMTMVQGGSNAVSHDPLPEDTNTYGCIVENTWISPFVLALAAFTAFILIITTLYFITILTTLTCGSLRHQKSPIKSLPDDLVSWMLQAAREGSMANQPGYITAQHMAPLGVPEKSSELRNWNVTVLDGSDGIARVVREKGERPEGTTGELGYHPVPAMNTAYVPPQPPVMPQTVFPPPPPMPMQQGGYAPPLQQPQQNVYRY